MRSPRERLLSAASELFYAEGIHTVGVERVLDRAGVAKATLYHTFGSKDALIAACLSARHDARQARVTRLLDPCETPRERLIALFDSLRRMAADPNFRGCAFARASAEGPVDPRVREVCAAARQWMRGVFTGIARAAGAADPDRLGGQLAAIYDGAVLSAWLDRDPSLLADIQDAASMLLDSASVG